MRGLVITSPQPSLIRLKIWSGSLEVMSGISQSNGIVLDRASRVLYLSGIAYLMMSNELGEINCSGCL